MRARATVAFLDVRENVYREAGEEFEATRERLDELSRTPYGKLAEEVPEPERKAARKPKTKE